MSRDGDGLLAASIRRCYRGRAAVRTSWFLMVLCHAGMNRGRIVLERAAQSRKEGKRSTPSSPLVPHRPSPAQVAKRPARDARERRIADALGAMIAVCRGAPSATSADRL